MSSFRHVSALAALVAFLGGGLVAPVLHRAAHGIEHAHDRHAAATQTDHVHADGVGLTVPLEGFDAPHDLCVLCLPKTSRAAALAVAPAPFAAEHAFASPHRAAPEALAQALLPIRGPPTVC